MVIGGSSGIGHEVARQTSAQGARLIIVGRNQPKLAAAAERLSGVVKTAALDAHDETALESFFSALEPFDHLVSMVGDSMAGGFLTTTPETMRHVLHSKFWTNWMIGRHAAPRVRNGGSITFTSGTGGRAQDVSASYVANLGIGALVQGLASELAPRVRVNAVAPTFMETPFWKGLPADGLEKARAAFTEGVPLKAARHRSGGRVGLRPSHAQRLHHRPGAGRRWRRDASEIGQPASRSCKGSPGRAARRTAPTDRPTKEIDRGVEPAPARSTHSREVEGRS